jgi:hypothetical protein
MQPGEPAEVFTSKILADLPPQREKARGADFPAAYKKALDDTRTELGKQFDAAFDAALATGPKKELSLKNRRLAIARLLINLCLFRAEEAIGARFPELETAAFGEKLDGSEQYRNELKRAMTVVGLRFTIITISDEARLLRTMAESVIAGFQEERITFASDHVFLLAQVRQKASEVEQNIALRERQKKLVADQEALVKKRLLDVKQAQEELAESQALTQERLKELRQLSDQLLALRTKVRDALGRNEALEKRIRSLEEQVRQRERPTFTGK